MDRSRKDDRQSNLDDFLNDDPSGNDTNSSQSTDSNYSLDMSHDDGLYGYPYTFYDRQGNHYFDPSKSLDLNDPYLYPHPYGTPYPFGAPDYDEGSKKITCRKCGCTDCRTKGSRIVRGRKVTQFKCKWFGHRFVLGVVLPIDRLRLAAEAADLLVKGFSLVDAADHISRKSGIRHDVKTVKKYIKILCKYLGVHIADILDDLEYGDVWEADETMMPLKAPTGHMGKIEDAYYAGAVDSKTRMPVGCKMTWGRPCAEELAELFGMAEAHVGMPRVIVTDGYTPYPGVVRNVFDGKVEHIVPPRKRHGSKGTVSIIKDGRKYNTAIVERFWSHIKSPFRPGSTYGEDWFEDYLELIVIYHSFIHTNMNLIIDGKAGTPAMAGGFFKRYDSIAGMFADALKNPKTAMLQLEREDLEKHVIIKSDSRRLCVRIKSRCLDGDEADVISAMVGKVLRECGFVWEEEQKQWASVDLIHMRQTSMRGGVRHPEMKTFEVCDFCGCMALSRTEVEEYFGYASSELRINMPVCKKCTVKMPEKAYYEEAYQLEVPEVPKMNFQVEPLDMSEITKWINECADKILEEINGFIRKWKSENGYPVA